MKALRRAGPKRVASWVRSDDLLIHPWLSIAAAAAASGIAVTGVRGPATRTGTPGTGLRLAIAFGIARRLGDGILIDDAVPRGARIVLHLRRIPRESSS